MYHAVGPQGADGGFWMRSHEFQIEEGDCGDYWACAGAVFDVNSKNGKRQFFCVQQGWRIPYLQYSQPVGQKL